MIFRQWEETLDGRKTQTRRLIEEGDHAVNSRDRLVPDDVWGNQIDTVYNENGRVRWQVGKTYAVQPGRGESAIWWRPNGIAISTPLDEYVRKMGGARATWGTEVKRWLRDHGYIEARIHIVSIRRELLQDISHGDAIAEGYPSLNTLQTKSVEPIMMPRRWFSLLWDGIHKKPGTRWVDNPGVWALTFRVWPY